MSKEQEIPFPKYGKWEQKPMRPDYDFEPGELMPWQEMSQRLRELAETCSELASIIGAEYSDIKTRLDDLEEQVGKLSPNWLCSESEASRHDELERETGTHPPDCGCERCGWLLWGS